MLGAADRFAKHLLAWYDRSRRDLPWRVPRQGNGEPATAAPDPYHVLVSEAMLQQTQVATVIPYFHRFIARFPTLADLAAADEQEVLRTWQGLGYYSRARNLQAAAKRVVAELGGRLPRERDDLLKLPGIGRYTAGAVASIAFGRRAPILDGNVMRVLCRIDRIETDPRERVTHDLLWRRAEEILPRRRRTGDFNSALMELGATVCVPRTPQCLICPVRAHCEAFAAGVQERIPAPRKAKATPLLRRLTFCIRRDGSGGGPAQWLIEQRPAKGRWAGMWQFVTIEPPAGDSPLESAQALLPVKTANLVRLGTIEHGLTHRRYRFEVFRCDAVGPTTGVPPAGDRAWVWVTPEQLNNYPLPRPHVRITGMIGSAKLAD